MKLLVTTDFSPNSKGALRFAQTLANQSNEVEVTFYHSVQFMKPGSWTDAFYKSYRQEETERMTTQLKKFVFSTVGKAKQKFVKINFVIDAATSTEKDIVRYAEKNKMDFICMATQGAGFLRKIIGTHTSYIVNNSSIPVLVIPSHYRAKPLKNITYLSDFENLKKELSAISKFSGSLKSNIEVLHYSSIIWDPKKFERNKNLFNQEAYKDIKLNIVKNNLELPLVKRVSQYVAKSKPQLLVMFTKREKSFFETIFVPSKSAELTFSTKVPVLIFSK